MGVFVVSMVVLTAISGIPAVSGDTGMSTMTLLQFLTGLVIPTLHLHTIVSLRLPAEKDPALHQSFAEVDSHPGLHPDGGRYAGSDADRASTSRGG